MASQSVVLPIEHIVWSEKKKQPMLRGTRFSVAFLVTFLHNPEWTVERMVENYPLTPAQIYAAWSYYYDHQEEIDRILREDAERGEHVGVALSSIPKFAERMSQYPAITRSLARQKAKETKTDKLDFIHFIDEKAGTG